MQEKGQKESLFTSFLQVANIFTANLCPYHCTGMPAHHCQQTQHRLSPPTRDVGNVFHVRRSLGGGGDGKKRKGRVMDTQ